MVKMVKHNLSEKEITKTITEAILSQKGKFKYEDIFNKVESKLSHILGKEILLNKIIKIIHDLSDLGKLIFSRLYFQVV